MSSVGQGLGGIVGGVIGFMVGGPSGALYGAQVGMMVGGLLDPPKVEGPRLEDLSQQTSTYGVFIPRAYGTVALHGNVFWIQGDSLIERGVESGGKGGPEVTNYEYYASFAISLCEGQIDGVRRIWIGGQLWYDAGVTDLASIIASNERASGFTLYTGTETQEADPLIQADRGIANVPAYRGLAYIVFNELPLKDVGNTIAGAQVKVEIVNSGVSSIGNIPVSLPNAYWGAASGNDSRIVVVEDGGTNSTISFDDEEFISTTIGSGNWGDVAFGNGLFVAVSRTGSAENCGVSAGGLSWTNHPMPSPNSWTAIDYGNGVFCAVANNNSYGGGASATSANGIDWTAHEIGVSATWSDVVFAGTFFCAISTNGYCAISPDGDTWTTGTMPVSNWSAVAFDGGKLVAVSDNGNTTVISTDGMSWSYGGNLPISKGWVGIAHNGYEFMAINNFISDKVATSTDGMAWTQHTIFSSDWNDIISHRGIFFAVGTTYPSNGAYIFRWFDTGSGAAILSSIVESECIKSSLLTTSDLDVTDLTDQVRGYRVSSLGPIRGGIDPLRKAWPFDVVQHGYQIKFKARGGASVATITEAELDAREAGASPGVQVTNIREMDTVLPDQLTTKYLDAAREYDINVAEQTR